MHSFCRAVAITFVAAASVLTAAASTADARSEVTCQYVRADTSWQATGVEVMPGSKVCVVARGIWSHGSESGGITPLHGADGYVGSPEASPQPIVPWPYARVGTLLGRIGDGLAFPIENELCFEADQSGELSLIMNDVESSYGDNRGALRVRISSASQWRTLSPHWDLLDALRLDSRCFR